jgi:hypothetical protein
MSWYSVTPSVVRNYFFKFSIIIQDALDIDRGGKGWNCEVMWRAQAAVLIAVAGRWEDVGRYHN